MQETILSRIAGSLINLNTESLIREMFARIKFRANSRKKAEITMRREVVRENKPAQKYSK